MRAAERGILRYTRIAIVVAAALACVRPTVRAQPSGAVERINRRPAMDQIAERPLTPLGEAVQEHGCLVAGDRVYVIGGTRGVGAQASPTSEVWSMPVEPGGGLGAARQEKSLPRPLTGLTHSCLLAPDQAILVAGGAGSGLDGPPCSNRVWIGRIDQDGMITGWTESSPWPGPPLADVALARSGSFLFVLGGMDESGQAHAETYRARIDEKGIPSAWSKQASLPESRVGHGAFCVGQRVYVAGGREARKQAARGTIFTADLGTSLSVTAWNESLARLPYAVADGAAAFLGGRFYWIGGIDSQGRPFPNVMFAGVDERRFSTWFTVPVRLPATEHIGAAVDPNGVRMFVCGGSLADKPGEPSNGMTVLSLAAGAVDALTTGTTSLTNSTGKKEEQGPLLLPDTRTDVRRSPFVSEKQAFDQARERKRPLLLIVYGSSDPESSKVHNDLGWNRRFLLLMAGIVVGDVDVDKDPTARERYRVATLPLFVVYDANGKVVRRDTSARTLKDFMLMTQDVQ